VGGGGAEFLHAGAAQEVAGELADGAAGEEIEGFEGRDEEIEEFDGGAEGGGEGAEGHRDFVASQGVAATGRFPAFWRVENTGFHVGKYEQDLKRNQVFSLILKELWKLGFCGGARGCGKSWMAGRREEMTGEKGAEGRTETPGTTGTPRTTETTGTARTTGQQGQQGLQGEQRHQAQQRQGQQGRKGLQHAYPDF
jgi:hypothetical protein